MVRQALSELQYEGVLDRVKGRGTFVAPQLTSQSLVQSLTGLHADVLAMGRTLRSDVRALKVVAAEPDVAARLEIPVGTAVVLTTRGKEVRVGRGATLAVRLTEPLTVRLRE